MDLLLARGLHRRVGIDDVNVAPHALPELAAKRAHKAPVAYVPAHLVRRIHLHRNVHLLARLNTVTAEHERALLLGHSIATHENEPRVGWPRHITGVLQPPDLGKRSPRWHLRAVIDGDVTHETCSQVTAPALGSPTTTTTPIHRHGRRHRFELSLLLRGNLVKLCLAQIVVAVGQMVPHADDGRHAGLIAHDTRMDALRCAVVWRCRAGSDRTKARRRDHLVVCLFLWFQCVVFRLAHIIIVANQIEPVANDRAHASSVTSDTWVVSLKRRENARGGLGGHIGSCGSRARCTARRVGCGICRHGRSHIKIRVRDELLQRFRELLDEFRELGGNFGYERREVHYIVALGRRNFCGTIARCSRGFGGAWQIRLRDFGLAVGDGRFDSIFDSQAKHNRLHLEGERDRFGQLLL
mmetsp:Transcript_9993/g.16664  ORF Transcript_9993/g.16664 Transcript_9993/m.16664 type:complete len:411 (-) Transcript_9993:222-1454(-)